MTNWKSYVILILVLAVFVGGIYLYVKSDEPKGPDYSKAIDVLPTRNHIPEGSPRPAYNSNPPTSGDHYDKPAHEGFYDQPIVDEHMVHNLEHGDIWVSYRASTTPASVVDQLKSLSDPKLVITPRADDPNDICQAAWGRLDCWNLDGKPLDTGRIDDFIKRYKYKGPEQIDPAFQVNFN
jgi:hypothetical protein